MRAGEPTHGSEPQLRRVRAARPARTGDSKLRSQNRTAPAVLAACLIAAGLVSIATASTAAALTHIPNIGGTDVQPDPRSKTKKQSTRGADAQPLLQMRLGRLLGNAIAMPLPPRAEPALATGSDDARLIRVAGSITWGRPASCLNGTLKSVLRQAASRFGRIHVTSTCRSRRHNRRVGGARHSHHIGGNAVDFYVRGNSSGARNFLRNHPSVGGFKQYRGGRFHIDTGPRRRW